jgi:hypothetical protein
MSIERLRQYQCLHYHLRMAHVLLLCAEEAEPGPDRISPLWCAADRLDNARRYATIFKLNLHRRIARLSRRYEDLARQAGEGEAIGDAFQGEIHIVSRDANGKWSERRERVH